MERLQVAVAIGKAEEAAAELVQSRVERSPGRPSQQSRLGLRDRETVAAAAALGEQEEVVRMLRMELDAAGAERRRLEKEQERGVAREEDLAAQLAQVEQQLRESWATASAAVADNKWADV